MLVVVHLYHGKVEAVGRNEFRWDNYLVTLISKVTGLKLITSCHVYTYTRSSQLNLWSYRIVLDPEIALVLSNLDLFEWQLV